MDGIFDAALGDELVVVEHSQGFLVDASVEHGVRVDRVLWPNVEEEIVQIAGVPRRVVGHLLEILQFTLKPLPADAVDHAEILLEVFLGKLKQQIAVNLRVEEAVFVLAESDLFHPLADILN